MDLIAEDNQKSSLYRNCVLAGRLSFDDLNSQIWICTHMSHEIKLHFIIELKTLKSVNILPFVFDVN